MSYVDHLKQTYHRDMYEALVNCGQITNFIDLQDEISHLTYAYVIYSKAVERAYNEFGSDWITFHYASFLVSSEQLIHTICPALETQFPDQIDYAFVHRPYDILVYTNRPLSPVWFRIVSGWRIAPIHNIPSLQDFVQHYQGSNFQ